MNFRKTFKLGLSLILLASTCYMEAKERKTLFLIVDGVPTDMVERLHIKSIYDVAKRGCFADCYVGGTIGDFNQTPTISAVGYNTLLTGTWVNKHNVYGNSNLSPNYNYWSFFRIAKEQDRPVKTAIFSSWTDNRTVLLGEGKPETNQLKIDYIYDGYDLDKKSFPNKANSLQVFDYDEMVTKNAAECIKKDGPDLSWVYLWYTDDASHLYGNGKFFDEYTLKAGEQIERIWEAVKYREAHYEEEWLVVLTTDHGRTNDGFGHGGQSARERKTWLAMNKKGNKRLTNGKAAAVDVLPTICKFMNFKVPNNLRWEEDGVDLIGKIDMEDLKATKYDNNAILTWNCFTPSATAKLYVSPSNKYKEGGKDEWIDLGTVKLSDKTKTINLESLPSSKFYKFVLVNSTAAINTWFNVK